MGMDVYGRGPTDETGEYFRRSVWGWRPLWDYCEKVAPQLTLYVDGQSNSGDGLNEEGSAALALALEAELDAGLTARYVADRKERLESMPDEPCNICNGTGKRQPPPTVGAGDRPCNGCESTGSRRPWLTWYALYEQDVRDFVAFLKSCGGFAIH
jgi:hypothetical protein